MKGTTDGNRRRFIRKDDEFNFGVTNVGYLQKMAILVGSSTERWESKRLRLGNHPPMGGIYELNQGTKRGWPRVKP